jgi:hypothetical protein
MRLWSLHPKYLDRIGLIALWREALLAKNVLENKTRGYKNHPQLNRFKKSKDPLRAINIYLSEVYNEAVNRKYNFDRTKFSASDENERMEVTAGQINYEFSHLKKKLSKRDLDKFNEIANVTIPEGNPFFNVVKGEVEEWEKVQTEK